MTKTQLTAFMFILLFTGGALACDRDGSVSAGPNSSPPRSSAQEARRSTTNVSEAEASSMDDDRFEPIDKKKIPASGSKESDFAPAGWNIASTTKGDLNGDRLLDVVLTLEQTQANQNKERARALVVLFAEKDHSWRNAAVADRLLNCVGCGLVMEELTVKIKNGVLDVYEMHGNSESNAGSSQHRFRYEPEASRFRVIGYDYVDNNGDPRNALTESSNYLTGVRNARKGRGKIVPSRFKPEKLYLDDLDRDKLTTEADARLYDMFS